MKNAVYYFSGTGNSFYAAKSVAKALDAPCLSVTEVEESKEDYDKAVIVFPSYAYGAPAPVIKFLKNLPFTARYLAVAVTCGSYSKGTLNSVKRILKRRKVFPSYYIEIKAPENFIPIFGAPKQDLLDKRLKFLEEHTQKLTSAVLEEQTNSIKGLRPFSAMVSLLFLAVTPFLAFWMRVKKNCTGCRLCEKSCPVKAIRMKKSGKASIRAGKCAMCQRCMNICPQKCITLGRLSKKGGRYFHPEVALSEVVQQSDFNIGDKS